ncbi:MAG: HAMP domain-containing histidine kinase [Chloroflexi bacterium]|nr:HAMP domain-containing histidine kinase [Chloroflexota bacterium]
MKTVTRRLSGFSLVAWFIIVGAGVGLLVAGAAAWFVEARLTDLLLTQMAARAVDQVQLELRDHVTPADFQPPHTPAKLDSLAARLDPAVPRVLHQGSGMIRLKIYALDGTILYSDLASIRGTQRTWGSDPLATAIAGTASTSHTSLSEPDNADLKARYGAALEVYVPFVLDGQTVGVYEIYQDLSPLHPVRPLVWSTALGGLAVLFLALIGMMHRAAARIQRQQAERERLARQVAEADALRNLNRLKDELLTTISHELRTPLSVVMGYAELLAMRPDDFGSERCRMMTNEIYTAAATLTRLVNDLLEFSHLERGQLNVQPRPVNLVPVVRHTVGGFRLSPSGERVSVELPETLWAQADPERTGQVVGNLLENALRYAPTDTILVRGGSDGDQVWIEVVDHGPGIAPEEQPRVWEKFYRGAGVAGLNIARGTGLGLAMVKALAEAQWGTVTLESAPGRGSTFRLTLPAASGGVEQAGDLPPPPPAPFPRREGGRGPSPLQ